MNQNQGVSSLTSPDLPMKRKRGRPRKDENFAHGESMTATPGTDTLKKTKQNVDTSDEVEDEMVGQVVSGVIEGSFGAGYLLNVKIGDTDTQLRGVAFLPGKVAPITAANDVAPHIKMCKRKEIPIPSVNMQSHLYGSSHPSEQSSKQPVEVKKQIPAVPGQSQASIPQTSILESIRSQPSSFVIPPVDNFPNNESPSFGGKVMPHQSVEPGPDIQSDTVMANAEHEKIVDQDKVSEEVKPTTTVTGPVCVEVNGGTKTETASEPIGDNSVTETICKDLPVQAEAVGSESSALVQDEVRSAKLEPHETPVIAEAAPSIALVPGIETECKAPHFQPQAMDSEKSQLVDDQVKNQDLDLKQTPVSAQPVPSTIISGVETVCNDSQIQPEDAGSEKNALVHDAANNLNLELNQTPLFSEPSLASDPTSKPVENLMEEEAYPAPKPSQMLGGGTDPSGGTIPSGMGKPHTSNPSGEGMVESHISNSSGGVDNVGCEIADAIPPAPIIDPAQ